MKKEEFRKIETFKDLEFEKERLNLQMELAEEKINNNFKSLANKLTIDSIATRIKESVLGTIYKTFQMGYNLFFSGKHKNEE